MEVLRTIEQIFAFNLKRLRGKRTQAEIAEAAGMSLRGYQHLEAGSIPNERKYRVSLARALNVSPSRLFADPDSKMSPKEAAKRLVEFMEHVPEDVLDMLARVKNWDDVRAMLAPYVDPPAQDATRAESGKPSKLSRQKTD